jgi:hypothetical protein
VNVRYGWRADIACARTGLHTMPVIRVIRTKAGHLAFPDFEDGSRLPELTKQIAQALGTTNERPVGSALELLVGFVGYPEQFQLWWDGVTCELGCSEPCSVNMGTILNRLVVSSAFATTD